MNIALIGCGYVADFYITSAKYHPELKFIGAFDKIQKRLQTFCLLYDLKKFDSLKELIDDPSVDLVLNLSNPRDHYAINKLCLESYKHVYSEKPLAMDYKSAVTLASLAKKNNCYLSSAPCSILGETAQTVLDALKNNAIGVVRLIYANFDAGMSAKSKPWLWRSSSGAAWPAKDEFEVGCTYEHAGYILTWLAAFFGPAKKITSFASCLAPDKGIPLEQAAPDFSVGCIEYKNNIIARITCSLAGPPDRSLTIIGDNGVIYVRDIRDDASPVYLRHLTNGQLKNAIQFRFSCWQNRLERWLNWLPLFWGNYLRFSTRYPFIKKPKKRYSAKYKPVDFCRGLAELAQAILEGRPCKLSENFSAHIVELTEALQYPERFQYGHQLETTFDETDFLSNN